MIKECYYCEKTFDVGKSAKGDHILPDLIGCRDSFKNVCSDCNISFEKEMDRHLGEAYEMLLFMLGISSSKDKKNNHVIKSKFSVIDHTIDLNETIKGQFTHNGVKLNSQKLPDGRLFIPTDNPKAEMNYSGKIIKQSQQAFGISVSQVVVDQQKLDRCFVKSCVNLIGNKCGIEYLKSLNLNDAKQFVKFGVKNGSVGKPEIGRKSEKKDNCDTYHEVIVYKEKENLIGEVIVFGLDAIKYILKENFIQTFENVSCFIPINANPSI